MIRTRAKRFFGKIVLNHNERAGWQVDGDPSRCSTYSVSGQPKSPAVTGRPGGRARSQAACNGARAACTSCCNEVD
jgi:hypothetical protein